jgi:hypothetical protein
MGYLPWGLAVRFDHCPFRTEHAAGHRTCFSQTFKELISGYRGKGSFVLTGDGDESSVDVGRWRNGALRDDALKFC